MSNKNISQYKAIFFEVRTES